MTHIRTRRPTRTHRITVRRTIEALAAFNHVSFNQQLLAMLSGVLGK